MWESRSRSRGSRGVRFRELGMWGIGYRGVAGVRYRAWGVGIQEM